VQYAQHVLVQEAHLDVVPPDQRVRRGRRGVHHHTQVRDPFLSVAVHTHLSASTTHGHLMLMIVPRVTTLHRPCLRIQRTLSLAAQCSSFRDVWPAYSISRSRITVGTLPGYDRERADGQVGSAREGRSACGAH
jgi:hypothetical protein